MQYCPQSSLEPMLLAETRRRGNEVRYGTELCSFEQDDTGVTAVLRDLDSGESETVRADYLIAADGVHSPIRESLGVTTSGYGALPIFVVFFYFRAPWRKFVSHLQRWRWRAGQKRRRGRHIPGCQGRPRHVHHHVFPWQGGDGGAIHAAVLPRSVDQGHRRADRTRDHRGRGVAALRAGGRPIPVRASLSRRRLRAHHAAVQGRGSQHCHPKRAQPGLEAGCGVAREQRSRHC